jgi:polyisoprenoid-binding protein YceI
MPRFVVDSSKTTVDVGLKVNVHPSHIKASGLTGFIECELTADGKPNLDAPYSAELTLPVDGIKSGNSLQDREMRRRFDAKTYPTIVSKVTKGEALPDGRYHAIAQLTMHGVTREIDGDVDVRIDGKEMTVTGEQTINVKDFGIDPPRLIILKVEPDVDVKVSIVAEQQ